MDAGRRDFFDDVIVTGVVAEETPVYEPPQNVDQLASSVIGACIEVHRTLGPGYLESVYQNALAMELHHRDVVFERERVFDVCYRESVVGQGRIDFLAGQRLIVELKAVQCFADIHFAQVISYLRAMNLPLGLLINFQAPMLKDGIRRVVYTKCSPPSK